MEEQNDLLQTGSTPYGTYTPIHRVKKTDEDEESDDEEVATKEEEYDRPIKKLLRAGESHLEQLCKSSSKSREAVARSWHLHERFKWKCFPNGRFASQTPEKKHGKEKDKTTLAKQKT